MKDSILETLLSVDDEFECEWPASFNREKAFKAVSAIQPKLESVLNYKLELDDTIQDASYFASLVLWKHVPADPNLYTAPNIKRGGVNYAIIDISFSSFGKLVTIGSSVDKNEQFPNEIIDEVVKLLKQNGFIYISEKDLQEEYCGKNFNFTGSTWGKRYFSYL